jgi:hypothetical protein
MEDLIQNVHEVSIYKIDSSPAEQGEHAAHARAGSGLESAVY